MASLIATTRHPSSARIGLALGGGAAHGFAHIPLLEALDELGLKPDEIVGTSMGAVLGATYASGMEATEIRAYAIDLFRNRSKFLGRLWKTLPRRFTEISFGIGQYDLLRVLRAFLPDTLPHDFAGLKIPFRAVATDYYAGRQAVLGAGPLLPAVAASAAVPMLFRPVMIGGRVMIDGGICNPVPFDLLTGVDIVIAVDVVTEPSGDPSKVPGGFASLFGASALLMRSVFLEKLKSSRPPDILIRPPTGGFNVLDFTRVREIIEVSEAAKDDLKRRLAALVAR